MPGFEDKNKDTPLCFMRRGTLGIRHSAKAVSMFSPEDGVVLYTPKENLLTHQKNEVHVVVDPKLTRVLREHQVLL